MIDHITRILRLGDSPKQFVHAFQASFGLDDVERLFVGFVMLEANPTLGGIRSIGRNLKNAISMPQPIDYFNLTDKQMDAIKNGVVASNTRPGFAGYTEEGNVAGGESFASKLPTRLRKSGVCLPPHRSH